MPNINIDWSHCSLFAVWEKYAEAVVQEEDGLVLTPGAGKNKVSTCGLVEVPLVVGGVKAGTREFPHMVRRIRSGCPLAFL
jgi:hypothetical protein